VRARKRSRRPKMIRGVDVALSELEGWLRAVVPQLVSAQTSAIVRARIAGAVGVACDIAHYCIVFLRG
jgi:hypothetical protein